MSNPSKAKGTRFESDLVEYLRTHGFPHAERRALSGVNDRGDVAGCPGLVWEAKARRDLDVAGAVDEAKREAVAGSEIPLAVLKRRMKPIGEAYVVLPLEQAVRLLHLAGFGEFEEWTEVR